MIERTSKRKNYAIIKEFSGYDRSEVAHRVTVHFFDAGSSDHTHVIIKDIPLTAYGYQRQNRSIMALN